MKLHFITCGDADDRFYSQICMQRLALNSLGGIYEAAPLTFMAPGQPQPIPTRWADYLTNVEVRWVDGYRHTLKEDADITIICDADTLLIKPLPDHLLESVVAKQSFCGVIAHGTPPRYSYTVPGLADPNRHNYNGMPEHQFWDMLAKAAIGRSISTPHYYTLNSPSIECPFYVNYGFLISTPDVFRLYYEVEALIKPKVKAIIDSPFVDQICVPLVTELCSIHTRALPLRFNFPTYKEASLLYPGELEAAHVIHFLDIEHYNRHNIFADANCFEAFLCLSLEGASLRLQRFIADLTGSTYPWKSAPRLQSPSDHPY